jgi:hypothetical protein
MIRFGTAALLLRRYHMRLQLNLGSFTIDSISTMFFFFFDNVHIPLILQCGALF